MKLSSEEKVPSKRVRKMPDAYVLIVCFALLAMVATWVVPAGEYAFSVDPVTNIRQIDPSSFTVLPRHPVTPLKLFLFLPLGLEKAAEVIFMLLLVGGFLQVISDTGAIDVGLSTLIRKLGNRGLLLIPMVMVFMSILGYSGILNNAIVAFIPLGLLVARRLNLDPVCGVAIMYLGCFSGFTPSAICAPTTLVAQKIAGLPPFSGLAVRTVVWLIVLAVTIWYVMRYASKVKADPSASIYSQFDASIVVPVGGEPTFSLRHTLVLLCLASGFVFFGWGAATRHWELNHLSAIMTAVGIFGGFIGGMKSPKIIQSFLLGSKQMVYSAVIIGLARAITLIMEDGRIIHTVVRSLSAPLVKLPAMISAMGMYLMSIGIHFFISSGSGQAYVTMPIMAPIADIVGLSRQTAVSAYLYGDGFINIIIPTSAVLMSVIATSKIPYGRWLKFAVPLCLIWILIGGLAIGYSTAFGW